MPKEIRDDVAIGIAVVALVIALVIGLRYVNNAEGTTGNVGDMVTEIQNRNPEGIPEVSAEDASGDTIMMGGPPRGDK